MRSPAASAPPEVPTSAAPTRAVCARDRLAEIGGHAGGPSRRLWLQAGLAALANLGAGPALAAPVQRGDRVPWPELRLLDGTRWARADDHAVVVVFWSLNCPFCLRHNAHVTRLRERAAGQRLQVLTAAREREPEAVQRHLARHGHRFDVTLDTLALASVLSLRRLSPLTVTVDRQGRLLQLIPGEMAEDDVMELLRLAA